MDIEPAKTEAYVVDVFGPVADPENDFADVYVRLEDGREYVATFLTPSYLRERMARHARTGEHGGGRYFWVEDMCIVASLDQQTVEMCVADLVDDDLLAHVFDEVDREAVAEGENVCEEDFADPVDAAA
ncbi:MAG: hypothetical protein BRD47_03175 [Bacteroidetes bacterium QS_8_68_28]|nr:MAG: hypothetical protein BRD47_03175 [Bacteroidetes bacterium QS_8_68_28]